jgi:hypothetical protein
VKVRTTRRTAFAFPGVSLSLALFLTCAASSAQIPRTVRVDFTKSVRSGDRNEVTSGTIHHDGSRTIVQVARPVVQWMEIAEKRLTLYYPDEDRGIVISSDTRAMLPFFDFFVNAARQDFGLNGMGYTLDRSETADGELRTYWLPPRRARKAVRPFLLVLRENRIVLTESADARGRVVVRTAYEQHAAHGNAYFPMKITTVESADGAVRSTTEVVYSDAVFDEPLAEAAAGFRLPPTARVETIRW